MRLKTNKLQKEDADYLKRTSRRPKHAAFCQAHSSEVLTAMLKVGKSEPNMVVVTLF